MTLEPHITAFLLIVLLPVLVSEYEANRRACDEQ